METMDHSQNIEVWTNFLWEGYYVDFRILRILLIWGYEAGGGISKLVVLIQIFLTRSMFDEKFEQKLQPFFSEKMFSHLWLRTVNDPFLQWSTVIKNDTRNRLGEILNELMILIDITEEEKATIDIKALAEWLAASWKYAKVDKKPWSEAYAQCIV